MRSRSELGTLDASRCYSPKQEWPLKPRITRTGFSVSTERLRAALKAVKVWSED